MKLPRDPLILAFVLLAAPAMAATRPAPVKPAPVPIAVSADDLMRQAETASAKGDKNLALRLAQAAIVADPARPAAYDLLADLYAGDGDGDFARFYYGEALGIDPSDAGATKGTAELDHGKAQQAAEAAAPAK